MDQETLRYFFFVLKLTPQVRLRQTSPYVLTLYTSEYTLEYLKPKGFRYLLVNVLNS